MKSLPYRLIVDVEFSRLRVVSQWPVLLRDWVAVDAYCDNVADDLRMGGRLLVATTLQVILLFVSVTWTPLVATQFFGDAGFWAGLLVAAATSHSFHQSYHEGRPWGLFWLIEKLERPIRLKPRRL